MSHDDPIFSMIQQLQQDKSIDLWKLKFMFAFQEIDPSIGRVRLEQVSRFDTNKIQETVPLQLVDCKELLDEIDGTNYSNNEYFDIKKIIDSF